MHGRGSSRRYRSQSASLLIYFCIERKVRPLVCNLKLEVLLHWIHKCEILWQDMLLLLQKRMSFAMTMSKLCTSGLMSKMDAIKIF